MKHKLKYIKVILILLCFVFLAAFTNKRHAKRTVKSVEINYTDENQMFIDKSSVNKLLIQNKKHVKNQSLENLDLNEVEKRVEKHAMVANAEVFLTIDGQLYIDIDQRKPIARVVGMNEYYIDSKGETMPLSENYSARVPIIFGMNENQIGKTYELLNHINKDLFLKGNVTQITVYPSSTFGLTLRESDFNVFIGNVDKLEQKFMNLKAFYVKAKKDKLIEKYKRIDLQYGNQVVCEKFEI